MNGESGTRRDIGFLVVMALQAVVIAWLVIMVVEIRSNRFTSDDGQDLRDQLAFKVDKTDVPPELFEAKVDRLEARQDVLVRDVARLEGYHR